MQLAWEESAVPPSYTHTPPGPHAKGDVANLAEVCTGMRTYEHVFLNCLNPLFPSKSWELVQWGARYTRSKAPANAC